MPNTFEFLAVEQILLYLVKNVPNPIFIKLGEGFLLAIRTPISVSDFRLYGYTRS